MSVQLGPIGGGLTTTLLYTCGTGKYDVSNFYTDLDLDNYDWYIMTARLYYTSYPQYQFNDNSSFGGGGNPYTSVWVSKQFIADNVNTSEYGLVMFSTAAYMQGNSVMNQAMGVYIWQSKLQVPKTINTFNVYGVSGINMA